MTHGSNGGPPDIPLTPKTKLECIRAIVERTDLSSPQKCIGVGIVLNADKDWRAEVKTAELQLYASAKDRETVFRATRVLDDKAIVSKDNTRGQSGKFTVLPPKVIDAIIEAFTDLQSSRVKADQSIESGRAKPDGTSGPVPTGDAVGFEPTALVKPVGFEPTSRVEPDQPSRAPAPALMESLRDSYSVESEVKNPLGSPKPSVDDLHRQAYEFGQRVKQGVATKSARAASRVKGELDGSRGIEFCDGKLTVMNGAEAKLIADFPGIDIAAVCDRAGPEITKMSYPTADDAMSVLRKWARIVMEEMRKQLGGASLPKSKAQRDDEERQARLKAQREQIRKEHGWTEEGVGNG